jgi:hypothetical protein
MRLILKTSLFVATVALVSTFLADYAHAQVRDAASKVRGGFDLYGGARRSYRSYSYAPRTRSVAPVIVTEEAVTTAAPTESATADAGTSNKKPQTAKKPTQKPTPTTGEAGVAAAPRRSYRSYSYEGDSGSSYRGSYRSSGRPFPRERFSFEAGRKIRGMGE